MRPAIFFLSKCGPRIDLSLRPLLWSMSMTGKEPLCYMTHQQTCPRERKKIFLKVFFLKREKKMAAMPSRFNGFGLMKTKEAKMFRKKIVFQSFLTFIGFCYSAAQEKEKKQRAIELAFFFR